MKEKAETGSKILSEATDEELWAELDRRYEKVPNVYGWQGWPIVILPDTTLRVVQKVLPVDGGVLLARGVYDGLDERVKERITKNPYMEEDFSICDPDVRLEIADSEGDYVIHCLKDDLGIEEET